MGVLGVCLYNCPMKVSAWNYIMGLILLNVSQRAHSSSTASSFRLPLFIDCGHRRRKSRLHRRRRSRSRRCRSGPSNPKEAAEENDRVEPIGEAPPEAPAELLLPPLLCRGPRRRPRPHNVGAHTFSNNQLPFITHSISF